MGTMVPFLHKNFQTPWNFLKDKNVFVMPMRCSSVRPPDSLWGVEGLETRFTYQWPMIESILSQ